DATTRIRIDDSSRPTTRPLLHKAHPRVPSPRNASLRESSRDYHGRWAGTAIGDPVPELFCLVLSAQAKKLRIVAPLGRGGRRGRSPTHGVFENKYRRQRSGRVSSARWACAIFRC